MPTWSYTCHNVGFYILTNGRSSSYVKIEQNFSGPGGFIKCLNIRRHVMLCQVCRIVLPGSGWISAILFVRDSLLRSSACLRLCWPVAVSLSSKRCSS